MKKVIFSLVAITLLFSLTACGKKNNDPSNQENKNQTKQEESTSIKGDVSNDICQEFSADFIYSVIRKPIVRVEPSPLATVYACDYYTDYKTDFYKDAKTNFVGAGGPNISIILDNLNVERQREARKLLGLTLDTSSKINMENIINYRKDKSIWSVDLIINPNRFVWTSYSSKAITDDELITLVSAMADKIQGRLKINLEKNPIDLAVEKEKSLGDSQQTIVNSFFDNLANLKITEALKMMDANDSTKQAWGVNFNTLISLKVNKLEEIYKEEWTATRQSFKAELEVKIKPEGEQMGWKNGKNYRWITLEKNTDGDWLIHELANNP